MKRRNRRDNGRAVFGPGSLTWRVNGEAVLLLGGGRALLLQVAHPGVAAGVAEFSNYREDPWRRLYRTLDTTLSIVFGDEETSNAASARLRRVHARVTGLDDRGEPYRALDRDLLLWVHATLIDTSLTIYTRYVGRLSPGELERYYDEMKALGEAYSIPREAMPADYDAFRRYWDTMLNGGLRVTATTRDVADAVLRPRSHPARMAGRRDPAPGDGRHPARPAASGPRPGLGPGPRAGAGGIPVCSQAPDAAAPGTGPPVSEGPDRRPGLDG